MFLSVVSGPLHLKMVPLLCRQRLASNGGELGVVRYEYATGARLVVKHLEQSVGTICGAVGS